MIELERTSVMNFENALRGARESAFKLGEERQLYGENGEFVIGEIDLSLAHRLAVSGSDHRKIPPSGVCVGGYYGAIYWWKEFDTYKGGAQRQILLQPCTAYIRGTISRDDFSTDHMTEAHSARSITMISFLEESRIKFTETKDKKYWYDIIQLLPSSYNQMRTVTLNYENLINMYYARRSHKLDEWHTFCDWIRSPPYASELYSD